MKDQIKELRVKIDGLAQLTKELKFTDKLSIGIDSIPNDFDTEHWLKIMRETQPFVFIKESESTTVEIPSEISKCYDCLILAKAWLGKILFEIGDQNPYAKSDGNRKTVKDIEPTADKANKIEDFPIDNKKWGDTLKDVSHIEKIDWLREKIKKTIILMTEIDLSDIENTMSIRLKDNVYNYLAEARFWLGFELQRIKEMKDEQ